jgi:hypothetical protein
MAVARGEVKTCGGSATFFVLHFGKKKGKLRSFLPIGQN